MGCQKQHLSNEGPSLHKFNSDRTSTARNCRQCFVSSHCHISFYTEDMQFIQISEIQKEMHLFCVGFPQENKEGFDFQLLLAEF